MLAVTMNGTWTGGRTAFFLVNAAVHLSSRIYGIIFMVPSRYQPSSPRPSIASRTPGIVAFIDNGQSQLVLSRRGVYRHENLAVI